MPRGVEAVDKVRTRRKALDRILELTRKALGVEPPTRVAIISLVKSAPPPNSGTLYETSSKPEGRSFLTLEEERRRW